MYICSGSFDLTREGLKLAAAIGTPRTVKVISQSPPKRRKKGPGPSSPHEYKVPSFKDEYSFTYFKIHNLFMNYQDIRTKKLP